VAAGCVANGDGAGSGLTRRALHLGHSVSFVEQSLPQLGQFINGIWINSLIQISLSCKSSNKKSNIILYYVENYLMVPAMGAFGLGR
jgi:hypothetical protein